MGEDENSLSLYRPTPWTKFCPQFAKMGIVPTFLVPFNSHVHIYVDSTKIMSVRQNGGKAKQLPKLVIQVGVAHFSMLQALKTLIFSYSLFCVLILIPP
jgi:hypothetical protein